MGYSYPQGPIGNAKVSTNVESESSLSNLIRQSRQYDQMYNATHTSRSGQKFNEISASQRQKNQMFD